MITYNSMLLCTALLVVSVTCYSSFIKGKAVINQCKLQVRNAQTSLFAEAKDNNKLQNMKGYYVRPSRAIEKGGGFFIPGLEDEKLRIVAAFVFFALFAINSMGLQNPSLSIAVSTTTGIIVALLLLWQGVAEILLISNGVTANTEDLVSQQQDNYISTVQGNIDSATHKVCSILLQNVSTIKSIMVLKVSKPKTAAANEQTISITSIINQMGPINQKPIQLLNSLEGAEITIQRENGKLQLYDKNKIGDPLLSWLSSNLSNTYGHRNIVVDVFVPESQTLWVFGFSDNQMSGTSNPLSETDQDFIRAAVMVPISHH